MHYKDGTLAKIGDHVKGKLYNTKHEVAGTLVSITPGVNSCNAMVAFVDAQKLSKGIPYDAKLAHIAKDHAHGSDGEFLFHVVRHDYCAVGDLEKVSSPEHAYELPEARLGTAMGKDVDTSAPKAG